jgi:diguanylate cyclase (GGDEF)-like protein
MLSSMSATDVAFVMIAVMQAVLAVAWLLGSWLVGDTRHAAVHWAAYAGLSTISFVLLTMALHAGQEAELLRAGGNLCGVLAFIALQRGVWLFAGRRPRWRGHALALAVALVAAWVGLSPEGGSIRVGITSGVFAALSIGIARDLFLLARGGLRFRWPWLLSVPLAAAAAGFAFRGLRALLQPGSVAAEMTTDSALNVGSALSYVVIALAFHATLITLVVGRLLAELQHRARHDGLTGLLNRRAMEEAMDAQMQRSQRNGESFSVLMLDLDHFKAINDRFGHAVGDRALKHAGALLKAGVREVDSVARFGGEEFVALMPGAGIEAARAVAERLREDLVTHPLASDAANVSLSASIGLAQWDDPGEDASHLLARADAALYCAKLQGRNRVVTAGASAEVGDITAQAGDAR